MKPETLLTIDVSHGTTHDGPGMRTTVFVKGCPLRCAWCQNPESIPVINGVWWDKTLCIGCGSCKEACPQSAITFGEKGILIDREKCTSCLSCADACPAPAMSAASTLGSRMLLIMRIFGSLPFPSSAAKQS